MKTDTINLRQQIQQLQDDNRRLQRSNELLNRENDVLSRTIDHLGKVIDRCGLQKIVDRWQQERELLALTPPQRN